MTMKCNRLIIILSIMFLLPLSLTSCGGISFRLDGDTIFVVDNKDTSYVVAADSSQTRMMAIGDFDAIDVSHAFKVEFSSEIPEGMAELTAPANLFDCIKCEVDDGSLEVRYSRNVRLGADADSPVVRLSSSESFESLDLSGTARMVCKDTLRLEDLEIDISGATGLDMLLTAKDLYLDISGASSVTLAGVCDKLAVDISGASHADSEALKAGLCEVDCSGASRLTLWCEEEAGIECSGASKVEVLGPGIISRQDVSGASKVSKR